MWQLISSLLNLEVRLFLASEPMLLSFHQFYPVLSSVEMRGNAVPRTSSSQFLILVYVISKRRTKYGCHNAFPNLKRVPGYFFQENTLVYSNSFPSFTLIQAFYAYPFSSPSIFVIIPQSSLILPLVCLFFHSFMTVSRFDYPIFNLYSFQTTERAFHSDCL